MAILVDIYFITMIVCGLLLALQSINAFCLTLVGPIYRHYIAVFWTKKPKKVDEWIFNGVYIITMSLVYPPYMYLFRKYSKFKTSLIYGSCFLLFWFFMFVIVVPFLDSTGTFE